jgi:hypothetical protein
MLTFPTLSILSFLLFRIVLAQQFINFTAIDPNQCVAPSAYLSCYEGVVENTAKCMNETEGDPTAQRGVGVWMGKRRLTVLLGLVGIACVLSVVVPECLPPLNWVRDDA